MKYNRTLHSPISLGTTSDDRFLPKGYLNYFSQFPNLILTEKLDGQNNCFSKDGLFARSHSAPSSLPWDKPLLERWELIKDDLGDLEIFGEGMYGIHSIEYLNLESYFYVFGVRIKGVWQDWETVKSVARDFNFPTVPEFSCPNLESFISNSPKSFSEDDILRNYFVEALGTTWEGFTATSGSLGGIDPITKESASEGLILRNSGEFESLSIKLSPYGNEFDDVLKVVRESHIKTDEHWTKTWKTAKLKDYSKYGWDSYKYLDYK